jgi:hypothetical protein
MLTKQALYTIDASNNFGETTYALKVVDDLVTIEAEDKEELYLGDLDQALEVIGETLKALKEVKNGD